MYDYRMYDYRDRPLGRHTYQYLPALVAMMPGAYTDSYQQPVSLELLVQ